MLARYRAEGMRVDVQAAYRLCGTTPPSQGWDVALGDPTMHLLAEYATTLHDHDDEDVLAEVRSAQADRLGLDGVVTTTGGQTAVLDRAAALLSKASKTVFAETSPDKLRERLETLAGGRGVGDTFHPAVVAYVAEALENVREHAVDVDADGLSLLQVKRINLNQMPGIEKQLPESAAFRQYIGGVTRRRPKLGGFLEITVADSGRGIPASLSGNTAIYRGDLADELRVLVDAFNPARSRKLTPGSGGGLTTMLENLHRRDGAIQVRSGRHSLFRTSVTPEGGRAEWTVAGGPERMPNPGLWKVSAHGYAAGTAITLLVPIDR